MGEAREQWLNCLPSADSVLTQSRFITASFVSSRTVFSCSLHTMESAERGDGGEALSVSSCSVLNPRGPAAGGRGEGAVV